MEKYVITHELRPCLSGALKRKALFHRWVEDSHAGIVGLVEYEDGHVARVKPNNILFIDSASKFAGFDWSCDSEEETE
jgi:hypothetical protein